MLSTLLLLLSTVPTGTPTADEIMARVADHQEKAQELRKSVVYQQRAQLRMLRGNQKLARELVHEYTVTPTEQGTNKERTLFQGRYEHKGKVLEFADPEFRKGGMDIDGDLSKELLEDLVNEKSSRDGIGTDMFPLTRKEQAKFSFQLLGRERYRDRDVWKVGFTPRKGEEDSQWKGEVLVDTAEGQPVLLTTWFAVEIPMLVKTLLGTNIRHLGFKLAYEPVIEGVWLPVTYSGEFEVRTVFLYHRKVAVSMRNSGFRRTASDATISYEK